MVVDTVTLLNYRNKPTKFQKRLLVTQIEKSQERPDNGEVRLWKETRRTRETGR